MASQIAKARVIWICMLGGCAWAYCNGLVHFMRSPVERRESNTRNTGGERMMLVVAPPLWRERQEAAYFQ